MVVGQSQRGEASPARSRMMSRLGMIRPTLAFVVFLLAAFGGLVPGAHAAGSARRADAVRVQADSPAELAAYFPVIETICRTAHREMMRIAGTQTALAAGEQAARVLSPSSGRSFGLGLPPEIGRGQGIARAPPVNAIL